MQLTSYHAKYFAYELTKKSASDSVQKLASTLVDAQVDLKPHQVEAALFAFRSPLSKGAILADEVGLGKTIEAALVISQKWAERKRKILIITPANLRKQWSQELQDKFFLGSCILEAKSFNEFIKKGNLNPFDQAQVIICSYQFARSKEAYLQFIPWDLAVIDEAHRLRNVYKVNSKIARSIKASLENAPKILLTATPLQNSLLELYGLVSIVDDYAFGDIKSFRAQYARMTGNEEEGSFAELKERLKPFCQRTLRRQVLQYISYTNRVALVEEFYPTEEEQRLYDLVSDYLQSDNLYALPAGQRKLMTLILRRLLASSTYAISGTLEGLAAKLQAIVTQHAQVSTDEMITGNFETYEELQDEWCEEQDEEGEERNYTAEDLEHIKNEIISLKEFEALAKSIEKNSKGEKLFTALERGFTEMEKLGAPRKAIIFTESTRTQSYLRGILEARGFEGRVVLFNGTNTDNKSKEIYNAWVLKYKDTDKISGSRSADMRAALVDYFRDEAIIMIATEAAAEGINLQFCSMIINYDMPWNPQRIEQRIGRCHRYGQKYDVVVVNFLNKANAADVRVYELLRDKFQLFSGVFGASDEILGSIENGVDFEKRIASIYQECRTQEQITLAFNELQADLEITITDAMQQTRKQLLENFDEEVHEKLRINLEESKEYLSRYERWLWNISRYYLHDDAEFTEDGHSFTLIRNPFPQGRIHSGPYRIGKHIDDANIYRIGHPLAQNIIEACKEKILEPIELHFDYGNFGKRITVLESRIGQSGYLMGRSVSINSFEEEEHIQLFAVTDQGELLDKQVCERFFSLSATMHPLEKSIPGETETVLLDALIRDRNTVIDSVSVRNANFFEKELEKLDHWGEDRRSSLKAVLKELDQQIKEIKKQGRLAPNLPEKLQFEKERKKLETERDVAWKEYDGAAREIEQNKDRLIDQVEKRMQQNITEITLFQVRWKLV